MNERVKHVRRNPFRETSEDAGGVSVHVFHPGVQAFKATPAFPSQIRFDPDLCAKMVIVVEGYKSGTYPTKEINPFTHFAIQAARQGIPFVLVSRSGTEPSSKEYKREDAGDIPILPLYNIIAETAIPLTSFVLGRKT